jgi:hypothetical protein
VAQRNSSGPGPGRRRCGIDFYLVCFYLIKRWGDVTTETPPHQEVYDGIYEEYLRG